MIRVDEAAFDRAKLAASLMRVSLAEYVSAVLRREADEDIRREAAKIAGGGDDR